MPSKAKPRSVRLGSLEAPVLLHAQDTGVSAHAAILDLIRLGLSRVTLPVTTPTKVTTPQSKAEKIAKARAAKEHAESRTQPKPPKDTRWVFPKAEYGSRLKGATKHKA